MHYVTTVAVLHGHGTYHYQPIPEEEAKEWIKRHHAPGHLEVCGGNQQVVNYLGDLTGLYIRPGKNPQLPALQEHEEALVLPANFAQAGFGRTSSVPRAEFHLLKRTA